MANRSHVKQEGPSEAAEDSRCAICLDNITDMACVVWCFHRFCSGCILRWATRRAVCPLCRQPIERVLHTVRADNDYQEYVVGSSSRQERRVTRVRSRRSPLRYRPFRTVVFPRRRSSNGSDQASAGDTDPRPSSTSSPQDPATSTSGVQSPLSTGERVVSCSDGEYVRIGTLQLTSLHIQLPSQRAQ